MHPKKRTNQRGIFLVALLALIVISNTAPGSVLADSASQIDRKVTEALQTLYDTSPGAKALSKKAKGMLVFPKIVKFGFLAGTQMGDGALLKETVGPAMFTAHVFTRFGMPVIFSSID